VDQAIAVYHGAAVNDDNGADGSFASFVLLHGVTSAWSAFKVAHLALQHDADTKWALVFHMGLTLLATYIVVKAPEIKL
jgi:hypothetical protein